MLMPKRVKYRKAQRGRMKGKAKAAHPLILVSTVCVRLSRLDHKPADRSNKNVADKVHEKGRQGVVQDISG